MIEYATRADMLRFASGVTIQEQATIKKRASDRSPAGTTFLSHSSKDQELVTGAIQLLEGHGGTVYIDKKDQDLPPYTNKDTAKGLKTRIDQCGKFVLMASNNSKDSRWVPWELGLADGFKGMDKVAILPTVENQTDSSWVSWEYLGLYNRIVWGDLEGRPKRVWMVLNAEKDTATELSVWLKR